MHKFGKLVVNTGKLCYNHSLKSRIFFLHSEGKNYPVRSSKGIYFIGLTAVPAFPEVTMKHVAKNTLKRLPVYLSFLKNLSDEQEYVSATMIAAGLKFGDVQVRKDLAAVSGEGKPKVGYGRLKLIASLEKFLGYGECKSAVIVGAGKLGMALFGYDKFSDYGMDISAAFDSDLAKIGDASEGKRIYHIDELDEYCVRNKVRIGIITTPATSAQKVCDAMVDCGIKVIWNFAPIHLSVPEGVHVQNENMAVSLAVLLGHLSDGVDID